mmetsp:Transcript_14440/g.43366  ORF Transcript_14440/g.43366 Transcript_14440/m.43366 type:complete len:285 (+) Transcript_14440:284-1138(+)
MHLASRARSPTGDAGRRARGILAALIVGELVVLVGPGAAARGRARALAAPRRGAGSAGDVVEEALHASFRGDAGQVLEHAHEVYRVAGGGVRRDFGALLLRLRLRFRFAAAVLGDIEGEEAHEGALQALSVLGGPLYDGAADLVSAHVLKQLPEEIDLRGVVNVRRVHRPCPVGVFLVHFLGLHHPSGPCGSRRCHRRRCRRPSSGRSPSAPRGGTRAGLVLGLRHHEVKGARDARKRPANAEAVPDELHVLDLVHLVEEHVRHAPAGEFPRAVGGVALGRCRP